MQAEHRQVRHGWRQDSTVAWDQPCNSQHGVSAGTADAISQQQPYHNFDRSSLRIIQHQVLQAAFVGGSLRKTRTQRD
jgi:hypothetical protein